MLELKDHLRDYATEAFRYYARCGRPTYEEMKRAIYNMVYESSRRDLTRVKGVSNPTQQAVIKAEAAVDAKMGELLDILAVESALRLMRPEWKRAVEIAYFAEAQYELERGEIKNRVTKAEIEIPASCRQVYRWLKKARELFAVERGLRLPG